MALHTAPRPRLRDNRPLLWWTVAAVCLVTAGVHHQLLSNLAAPTDPVGVKYDFADFRDTTWTPALDFLRGHVPWDTVPYRLRHPNAQPFLLYVPSYWPIALALLALPYHLVVALWVLLSVAALGAVVAASLNLLWPWLSDRHPWAVLVLLAFFVFTPPGKYAIYTGNWVTICSAAAVGTVLVRGRDGLVALLLCVAVVKPQVGLPAAIALLCVRRWRPVLWAALASVVLSLPVVLLGWHRAGSTGAFARMMVGNVHAASNELETRALPQVDVSHLAWLVMGPVPSAVRFVLMALAAAVTLGCFILAARQLAFAPVTLVAWGLFMVLVTPNLLYSALSLVPGLLATARQVADRLARGRIRAMALPALALLTLGFPFVNFQRLFPMLGSTVSAGYLVNAVSLCVAALALPGWLAVALRAPAHTPRHGL